MMSGMAGLAIGLLSFPSYAESQKATDPAPIHATGQASHSRTDHASTTPTERTTATTSSIGVESGSVVVRDGFLGLQEEYAGHAAIFWFYDARADEYRVLQASGFGKPAGPRTWSGFISEDLFGIPNNYIGALGINPVNAVVRDQIIYSSLYHTGAPYSIHPIQSVCGLDIDCDFGNEGFQTTDSMCNFNPAYIPCDGLRCDGFVDLVYRDNGLNLYDEFIFLPSPLQMYSRASSLFQFNPIAPKAFGQLIDPTTSTVMFVFDEWMSKYSLFDENETPVSISATGSISGTSLEVELVEYTHPQRLGGEIMDFLYWFDPNPAYDDWQDTFDESLYYNGPQWPSVYHPEGWGSLPSGDYKNNNRHDVSAVTVRVTNAVQGEVVTISIGQGARDLGGNPLQSNTDGASVTFTAGDDIDDITPPVVQVLNPYEGQVLDGISSTVVRVSAMDYVDVDRVEFFADGLPIGVDDTPNQDDEFHTTWFLDDFFGQVLLQAIAYDTSGNNATDSVVLTVDRSSNSCGVATFGEWELVEIGDGDGVIERGESAEVSIPITATGGFMNDVVAILIPNVPGFIKEPDNIDDLGGFTQGQTKTAGTYLIDIPSIQPSNVPFRLVLTYNDGTTSCTDDDIRVFSFPPQGASSPQFSVCDITLVEDDPSDVGQNNGNGSLENGEDAAVRISIENNGNADALNVRARPIGFDDPGLDVDTNYEYFGDIPQGDCITTTNDHWDLDADRTLAPGVYTSDIEITYDGAPGTIILLDALQVTVEPEGWLVVMPSSKDFGVVGPGDTVSEQFEIVNDGTESLTVTDVVFSESDTTLSRATPFTVAAGSSEAFSIQVDTESLNGAIAREAVFMTDGRVRDPGEDDTARVSGLISSSFPAYSTGNPGGADDPEVGGGYIVWEDNRSGDWDIWGLNLSTGESIPIVTAEGDQWDPRISGEWLVWEDSRGGSGSGSEQTFDIRAMHLPTGNEILVAATSLDERVVGIYQDYIAFRRGYVDLLNCQGAFNRRCYNLYVYRISDSTITSITNYSHSGTADAETVSDDNDFHDGFLVWEQFARRYDNGNWQGIVNTTLRRSVIEPTCSSIDFTPDTLIASYDGGSIPSTSNCRVVWEQDGSDGCDINEQIILWDNGTTTQITPNFNCEDAEFRDPVISGDLVVYEKVNRDLPGRPRYLAMRSVSSGVETIITTSAPLNRWRMDENIITWQDSDSGEILFSYLNTPDFGVTSSGISVQNGSTESEPIQLAITVTNNTPLNTGTGAVLRVFNGDPASGGTELANATVPALSASSTVSLVVDPFYLSEGTSVLYASVESSLNEYFGNNTASLTIEVGDSDTTPPLVTDVAISEHLGDNDGLVEPGEAFKVSWSATDPSSIGSTSATVNGIQRSGVPISGNRFEALFSPLNQGVYPLIVSACDDDFSPSCTTTSSDITIENSMPDCYVDFNDDGFVNFFDVSIFIQRYQATDPSADCNGDGAINFFDVSCFIMMYQSGCP